MALSCIIAPKSVEYYKDGKLVNVIQENTDVYQTIYENIRFKAWNLFGKICYKTKKAGAIMHPLPLF